MGLTYSPKSRYRLKTQSIAYRMRYQVKHQSPIASPVLGTGSTPAEGHVLGSSQSH